MADDLIERVVRAIIAKGPHAKPRTVARAALAVALEEAAEEAMHFMYGHEAAAAIRALIKKEGNDERE